MVRSPAMPAKASLTETVRLLSAQAEGRRVNHGGSGWRFAPSAADRLYQPQDGALPDGQRIAEMGKKVRKVVPGEPEDARLTGGTRSLSRRLSGLNLDMPRSPLPAHKASAA